MEEPQIVRYELDKNLHFIMIQYQLISVILMVVNE